MVPAGSKARRLSSVNHTTKTIHHHHQRRGIRRRYTYLFCYTFLIIFLVKSHLTDAVVCIEHIIFHECRALECLEMFFSLYSGNYSTREAASTRNLGD